MMDKWRMPIRPSIIEGESLEGYLVRLSQINGYDDIDDHTKLQYHYSPILREIKANKNILPSDNILYDLVEVLTGYEISRRNHDRKYLCNQGLLIGHGDIGYPPLTRYCPLCLKDHNYHRIHWLMIPYIICEKHMCFLRHQCPKCNFHINLRSTVTGICSNCENDITDIHIPVSEDFLIEHPYLAGIDYMSPNAVFLNLSAVHLFNLKKWLIYCIGKCTNDSRSKISITYPVNSTVIRISERDIEMINSNLILADTLLKDWPNKLVKYVDYELKPEERTIFIDLFVNRKHPGRLSKLNFLNSGIPTRKTF